MTACDRIPTTKLPRTVHPLVLEYFTTLYLEAWSSVNSKISRSKDPQDHILKIEKHLKTHFQTMSVGSYQKIRDAFANHNPLIDTDVNQGQESEDIWIIHKHELEVWDKLSDLMAFCHESKQVLAVRLLTIA